jgi:integrase
MRLSLARYCRISHGLRVSEAITLRWEQVDLRAGLLYWRNFVSHQRREGRKTESVNLALGTVQRILDLAANE